MTKFQDPWIRSIMKLAIKVAEKADKRIKRDLMIRTHAMRIVSDCQSRLSTGERENVDGSFCSP